jgi:hypothetical protein
MTELKFTCPSCGQAIQCSPECANQNVPCPACASLIRVPADAAVAEVSPLAPDANPFQPEESAKVSYTAAEVNDNSPKKEAAASLPGLVQNSNTHSNSNPVAASASQLHCVCPVCQSELQISLNAKPNALRRAVGDRSAASSALGSQQSAEHLSLAEREKKIATAREAHPVTSYPVIKPRLDKILSDESAKLEFVPPQMSNSAEEYKPEIDPDQIFRSHNSE